MEKVNSITLMCTPSPLPQSRMDNSRRALGLGDGHQLLKLRGCCAYQRPTGLPLPPSIQLGHNDGARF
jgi:hypothetical protein